MGSAIRSPGSAAARSCGLRRGWRLLSVAEATTLLRASVGFVELVNFSLMMRPQTLAELRELAEREGLPVSTWCRMALEDLIAARKRLSDRHRGEPVRRARAAS